ncbi:DUF2244 domain-containing protein [Lichenicoccus sp.]|uniref:DUF2244 domain-containing protein n=1 Tax=Lichenicoccus sp. TaxID=2781899 RepID=UPI003D112F30
MGCSENTREERLGAMPDRLPDDEALWGPVLFEARMTPNSSLSAQARTVVILLLTGASVAIGTLFWVLGAWPVPGFCGLEVLLACMLLYRNARDLRRAEWIELREQSLLLTRIDSNQGKLERRLSPYWLRVDLHDRPGSIVRVRLHGHGVQEEIGRFLDEVGRRVLAQELRVALHSCRNPRYENFPD